MRLMFIHAVTVYRPSLSKRRLAAVSHQCCQSKVPLVVRERAMPEATFLALSWATFERNPLPEPADPFTAQICSSACVLRVNCALPRAFGNFRVDVCPRRDTFHYGSAAVSSAIDLQICAKFEVARYLPMCLQSSRDSVLWRRWTVETSNLLRLYYTILPCYLHFVLCAPLSPPCQELVSWIRRQFSGPWNGSISTTSRITSHSNTSSVQSTLIS